MHLLFSIWRDFNQSMQVIFCLVENQGREWFVSFLSPLLLQLAEGCIGGGGGRRGKGVGAVLWQVVSIVPLWTYFLGIALLKVDSVVGIFWVLWVSPHPSCWKFLTCGSLDVAESSSFLAGLLWLLFWTLRTWPLTLYFCGGPMALPGNLPGMIWHKRTLALSCILCLTKLLQTVASFLSRRSLQLAASSSVFSGVTQTPIYCVSTKTGSMCTAPWQVSLKPLELRKYNIL